MSALKRYCIQTRKLLVSQERGHHKGITRLGKEEVIQNNVLRLIQWIVYSCDSLLFSISFKYHSGLPHVNM